MINLSSPALKIRVILPPVDMRKSFDGLTGVLREFSIANLNAQFLYAFSNKRRNRVKLLYFDHLTSNMWSFSNARKRRTKFNDSLGSLSTRRPRAESKNPSARKPNIPKGDKNNSPGFLNPGEKTYEQDYSNGVANPQRIRLLKNVIKA